MDNVTVSYTFVNLVGTEETISASYWEPIPGFRNKGYFALDNKYKVYLYTEACSQLLQKCHELYPELS